MKTIYYFTIVFLLFASIGCDREEVPTFEAERGINFVQYNANYNQYTDDYESLESTFNFYNEYSKQGSMTLAPCSLYVGLQLEGTFNTVPTKVKIKAEPVEGYDMPDITLPEEVIIEAGEHRCNFQVVCQQPKDYDKEFKVKLSIDYSNSDVVAGTKERQSYVITITDETNWKDMYVQNAEEWNRYYSEYLGNCGGKKIRFIFVSLAKQEYTYSKVRSIYNYTKANYYVWFYGWGAYGYYPYSDLETYNSTHDTPLCEPDGTPIEFPNIF